MDKIINNEISLNPSLMNYEALIEYNKKQKEKINGFKQRLEPFKNVATLKEAKELAIKILPTSNEINRFYVGDAKCTVINRSDLLRISVDALTEFICYEFV